MKSLALGLLMVGLAAATVASTTLGDKSHDMVKNIFDVDRDKDITGMLHGKMKGEEVGDMDIMGKSAYRVEIDEREITDLIHDFREFGSRYLSRTKAERLLLLKKLREAFKHAGAKMLLNFGRVFPPLTESYAALLKYVQVDKNCDQECAVECLDYRARPDTLFFNPTCLKKCKCTFALSTVDPSVIDRKIDEVLKNAEHVNRFFKNVGAEGLKIVKPTLENYMVKTRSLHEEFGDLIKEHGVRVFGCDESCVSDCVDRPDLVSFWEVPICLSHCKCGKGLIHIERDIPGLTHSTKLFGTDHQKTDFDFLESIVGDQEEDREIGILDRLRFRKTASLFSNVFKNEEEEKDLDVIKRNRFADIKEDIEEFLEGKKEDMVGHKHNIGCHRSDNHHKGYNIPELMRYSDYDKKAWNFFKRYEDEI
jgi:hypothetical protein